MKQMVRRHVKKPAKIGQATEEPNKRTEPNQKQPKRTAHRQTESRKGFRQHAEVHVEIDYGRRRHQMHWQRTKENHKAERGTNHMVHSRSALPHGYTAGSNGTSASGGPPPWGCAVLPKRRLCAAANASKAAATAQ